VSAIDPPRGDACVAANLEAAFSFYQLQHLFSGENRARSTYCNRRRPKPLTEPVAELLSF